MKSRIGLFTIVGLALAGASIAPSAEAASPPSYTALPAASTLHTWPQCSQIAQTSLPISVTAQIMAAIKSGNTQTLTSTIAQLVHDNPKLTGSIVDFAVTNDPQQAPAIAIEAVSLVQGQGCDPAEVTALVVGSLETLVLPAGGSGGGGPSQDQIGTLISLVLTGVGNSNGINPSQGNVFPQYQFGLYLPPPKTTIIIVKSSASPL
jgi:hypothetical protein